MASMQRQSKFTVTNRHLLAFLVFSTICGFTVANAQDDRGVVVNDIVWSIYNVGEKGKFVSDLKEKGNLYKWKEAKTVCPASWRLPTIKEIEALVSLESNCLEDGREFIIGSDKLFFPAPLKPTSLKDVNSIIGKYWGGTPNGDYPKILNFSSNPDCNIKPNSVICYMEDRNNVRCVKDKADYNPSSVPALATPLSLTSTFQVTGNMEYSAAHIALKGTEWFDNVIYALKFDSERNFAVCNFFVRNYSYSYTFDGEYGKLRDNDKGIEYSFKKYKDKKGEHIIVYKFDYRDRQLYDVIFDLRK